MDSQSCCTDRIVRCIFLSGFLAPHTHSYPRCIFPDRCTQGHSDLSGRSLHFPKKMDRCPSGTVVQSKARSTHTGRTHESHGHCRRGCVPHGCSCSHTDLKRLYFYFCHIIEDKCAFFPSVLKLHSHSVVISNFTLGEKPLSVMWTDKGSVLFCFWVESSLSLRHWAASTFT